MSTHISAKPGEIAEKILIQAPGTKVAPTPIGGENPSKRKTPDSEWNQAFFGAATQI